MARLRRGPSADDLAEMPATGQEDWTDAELVRLVDRHVFNRFVEMLDRGEIDLTDEQGRSASAE